MKRYLIILVCMLFLCGGNQSVAVDRAVPSESFYVYADNNFSDNHYIPSGLMGDYSKIYVDQNCKEEPYQGASCIKITYSAKGMHKERWAGVYWQNPANNWGMVDGGYDLMGARQMSFWAKGEKGGEVIALFKIGGISGSFTDTAAVEIGPVVLTDTWQEFIIDLSGRDLSYISGGFCWVTDLDKNPEGLTFYLDEIRYEM